MNNNGRLTSEEMDEMGALLTSDDHYIQATITFSDIRDLVKRMWEELIERRGHIETPISEIRRDTGKYCRNGTAGCMCNIGFPYDLQCPDCRDTRDPLDNRSRCVCPPKGEEP